MIEYSIKRSRRKTLSAYVLSDGSVEVRSPMGVSLRTIDAFVRQNEDKLKKFMDAQIERADKKRGFKIEIGSRVMLLGEEFTVRDGGGNIEIKDGCFYVQSFNAKAQVTALYKAYARRFFTERVEKYSRIMGLYPNTVKINSAKTRWGSCSAKGAVNLSWRLVMASAGAVDYVVIHELAHLKHMNHSAEFWRLVEKYEPNYREYKVELKALAERLRGEDWD
ncbi:MAG: M48 family metallopeptidase [Firmicutes bacterium]|nr:M48 family metallopeptidase [Bacillota bacterium]